MRVNVWGINYKPELIGIAVYNTQLCEFLASRGHDVTMVTAFPYYPEWKIERSYRGKTFQNEQLEGVNVKRCWLYVPSAPSVLKRILHELSFVISSTWQQLFLPAPDIYFVVSPPLFLGLAAWLLSLLKKRPFIFHIQDLQPDTALELSMLKSSLIARVLLAIEAFIYKRAARISAPTHSICELLVEQKKVPSAKVSYFPNWVTLPSVEPPQGAWKAEHGIGKETALITYSGNVGVKQGLELVIEAARAMDGVNEALFLIAGNGAQKRAITELVQQQRLTNVMLSDVMPESEHTQVIVDSAACLITQRPGSGKGFFPSKLLKILAYGRPVITNAQPGTPLYEAVTEGGFGVCLPANSAEELAETVQKLITDRDAVLKMSEAGKRYVAQFDVNKVLADAEKMLSDTCREHLHETCPG